ncbi:uncharacterized protein LOC131143453 [Malania oleifera]|uniref:uncharacterized protein LOC131143453 n=1 Tax=Malania oleifera TaxID=397392 RepID=UPI0025ADA16A|nr:uncharacterized protein LOC131143453 [Malania oleifera]
MAESDTVRGKKRRPIVRIGIFLIAHSLLVSAVCCTAGVLALLLLPVLAKTTYVSENALMPGSVNTMLSTDDIMGANRLMKELTSSNLRSANSSLEISRLIAQHMENLGAEVSYHKFYPQLHQFHPLHFFSGPDSGIIQENCSCSSRGVSAVGIMRAPRGDGKEAIVLVTPYNSSKINPGEALSLGIAYSVFSLLARVTWLAKDIIWLAADSQFGEHAPVAAWLRDYHGPLFSGLRKINVELCDESNALYELQEKQITNVFRRAGTMAAALVIKVANRDGQGQDTLRIYAEASNGQMPNLDLINVVNYLAVHRQGLRVKVEKLWSLIDSKWVEIVGEVFEFLGKVVRRLNPQWEFGIPVADYVEGSATLASSLYFQALGIPTGPHGAFRDYQVDAITLEVSPKAALINKARRNEFLLRGGGLIERVIRSVNNLLEKFHQSFFLYLLTSPSKFVSVGVYMIAFALLIAPLPMVAASLYAASKKDDTAPHTASADGDLGIAVKSWKWLFAAKQVLIVHLWGTIVSFFPFFICQIPNCTPTTSIITWVLLSMFSLLILYFIFGSPFSQNSVFESQNKEWTLLKSVTISVAFIGLCLMSIINFATAELGAMLLVPMCLIAHPLKLEIESGNLRSFIRAASNLILGVIGFPPAAFFVLKGIIEGFSNVNVGDFWTRVESLWAWNSATYLYMGMIHLPCWALCIHILFHPH